MARTTAIILTLLIAGCGPSIDFTPTPHQRYASAIQDSGMREFLAGERWLATANRVLLEPTPIQPPYQEQFWQDAGEVRAEAWEFELADGDNITVTLDYGPDADGRWFVDLFKPGSDQADHLASLESNQSSILAWEADSDTALILRAQPELLARGAVRISIELKPALTRPLDVAISSGFGAPRDGGSRRHHGVDLFAPRGTEILAADNGHIVRVGNRGIGGLHIWQSAKGRRLYYAHLDEVLVQTGQRVQAGEVIARVGNSGNARTTSPHLHFGIYERLAGPVDPAPLIRRVPKIEAPASWVEEPDRSAMVKVPTANLRGGPGTSFAVLDRLSLEQAVEVEGLLGDWYRISTTDGQQGFVAARLLR